MTTANDITSQLKALGNAEDAAHAQRFFKTGPGEYGEGDVFLGIRMPTLRKLAKNQIDSPLDVTVELLQSPLHEVRMTALLIWTYQAKRGAPTLPLYRTYMANTRQINNWDLVDLSAEHIVGRHLFDRSRTPLYELAKSDSLWERRIAILSTLFFIRRNEFDDTLALADCLLHDPEDLLHKAVGWMLREVGKRDQTLEESFLLPRYSQMPRTMLRYAIERFPEPRRLEFLHGRA